MFVECFESPVVGTSSTLNYAWKTCSPASSQNYAEASDTTARTNNVLHSKRSNSYTTLNPLILYDNDVGNDHDNDNDNDDDDENDDEYHIKTTNV